MTAPSSCRLYLVSPRQFELAEFAGDLAKALAAGDAACLLLVMTDAADEDLRDAIAALAPICHNHDVALIVFEHADLVADSDADGVHVAAEDYQQARELMGQDRIVGVTANRSRHSAMDAADSAADFVAFAAGSDELSLPSTENGEIFSQVDMIRWWQDLIEVPCIATGIDTDGGVDGLSLADFSALAAAGADFVAVSDAVWRHADGPAAGLQAANAAVNEAISVALAQST